MIVFQTAQIAREAQRRRDLYLIFRLVRAVAAAALRLPVLRHGEGVAVRQLRDVVEDAVLIAELRRLELAAGLIAEAERHARIDDGLPLERVKIILHGDVDVREDLEVRLPVEQRAGLFAVGGLFLHLAVDLALFEVEVIFEAVAEDPRVEILRGILRGAGAEAVQAEAVFIIFAGVVVVFAARVHLAEDQLPVVALLLLVPVHRAAAAEVLDLDAAIGVARDDDELAIALARLVNGVRQDLKHGVLAAVQPVGAKNDRGALANALRAFERGNALVAVCLLFGHNVPRSAWFHDRDNKYSISRRLQNVKKSAKGRTRGIYYGYHSCSGALPAAHAQNLILQF